MEKEIKNSEVKVSEEVRIRVPEDNEQELVVKTDDAAAEIELLSKKLNIELTFAESIEAKEDDKKYYPVIESKITGSKKRYSFDELPNVPSKLIGQGHRVNERVFQELITLVTGQSEASVDIGAVAKKYSAGMFHEYIGWDVYKGETVFKYNEAITANGNVDSSYEGDLDIRSRGSVESYFDGIKELVVPYPALLTVYLAGISGIITQMLNMPDSNIMLNICGESSCGKTTAENVALSFWGNPQELSTTFNSTANRIEQIMAERKVMPVLIDDMLAGNTYSTERVKQKIINDQIFRYATGRLKGRMGSKEERYYGAAISSSETSLLEKLGGSETDGQFYRMIELKVKKGDLTKDADHARQLERLIRRNYGLGAFELGKYMINNGLIDDELMNMYEKWEEELIEEGRLNGKDRAAKRLAIILLAAELLNGLGLEINYEAVKNVLINAVTDTFKIADEKVTAYENIRKFIKENGDAFATNRAEYDRNAHIGVCETNEFNSQKVYVETCRIEALIRNLPLQQILHGEQLVKASQPSEIEVRNILRYWREKGWLCSNGGGQRLTTKLKMGDQKEVLVYNLIFAKEEEV